MTLCGGYVVKWWGRPCPTCLRLMDDRNKPRAYCPPTAPAGGGIFRVVCRACLIALNA